jgi:hypothetical protein
MSLHMFTPAYTCVLGSCYKDAIASATIDFLGIHVFVSLN